MVRGNMSLYRLEDMNVLGKIDVTSESGAVILRTVETIPMRLTDLCFKSSAVHAEITCAEGEHKFFETKVFRDGIEIGYIDSSQQFNYTAAPDLRTCVAWAAVTDLGQEKRLDYDVDAAAQELTTFIQGVPDDTVASQRFFGEFKPLLKKVFAVKIASRYGDGYLGVASLFWTVATRTILGRELPHPHFLY